MILAPGRVRRIGFAPAGRLAAPNLERSLDRSPLRSAQLATNPGPAGSILATLRVRSGTAEGGSLPVRRAVTHLGADLLNDVVLAGEGVAARHAALRLRGGVWTVISTAPGEPILVDGAVVEGEALLAPGSAIRVGDVALTFAPEDRWQDSPVSRAPDDAAPFLVLPDPAPESPALWIAVAIGAVVIVAFFLLRTG